MLPAGPVLTRGRPLRQGQQGSRWAVGVSSFVSPSAASSCSGRPSRASGVLASVVGRGRAVVRGGGGARAGCQEAGGVLSRARSRWLVRHHRGCGAGAEALLVLGGGAGGCCGAERVLPGPRSRLRGRGTRGRCAFGGGPRQLLRIAVEEVAAGPGWWRREGGRGRRLLRGRELTGGDARLGAALLFPFGLLGAPRGWAVAPRLAVAG